MASVYDRDISHLDKLDFYRLADLYSVKGHQQFQAMKKVILAGQRGNKDFEQDIKEAIQALERLLEMRKEDDEIS